MFSEEIFITGFTQKKGLLIAGISEVSNTTSQMTGMTGMSSLTANNDWQIDAADIEIVKRVDGSDWLLGDGAFGQVTTSTELKVDHRWCQLQ